jgi:hypothetical protein
MRIAPLGHGKKSANPKNFLPSKRFEKFRKGCFSLPSFLLPPKEMRPGAWGRSAPNKAQTTKQEKKL